MLSPRPTRVERGSPGYGAGMRRPLATMLVVGLACTAAAGCGGGSGGPEGSLEVTVSPVSWECEPASSGLARLTCPPISGVALLDCPSDEISYELPDGVSASEVDPGEVCEQIADEERLLEPEAGESCAQPRGRVTVVGELDGEPVRLALRSCPDGGAEADEWARLVGLPFAAIPRSE